MTNCENFRFLSSDGKTQLHACLWIPDEKIKFRGVLQIAHGVAEQIGRYDDFARYLNQQGIVVAGHDHLGHGQSLPEGGIPVYFGEENGWTHAVDDIHGLHEILAKRFKRLPHLIMGHSMGSFLTRTYLIRYPGEKKVAIIMGTGWQPGYMLTGGSLIAKRFYYKNGGSSTSDFVTALAFGGYNRAFAPNRTGFDWLSADPENVDRYIADPLCGADATVGLFRDMLGGIRFNQKPANLKKMDTSMPVLFIAGEDDPVGAMGKGVKRSCAAFQKAGMQDVTLKLYPGLRHEILNEKPMQQTVYADIHDWLSRYI